MLTEHINSLLYFNCIKNNREINIKGKLTRSTRVRAIKPDKGGNGYQGVLIWTIQGKLHLYALYMRHT